MPDEIILRPRTQISYELSRNDPELYRHMLVNSTIERNERSKNLFSWLDKQELFAEDQIEIDISAYDSSSDPSSPRIRFGSGVMPKSEVDKRIYRGERYSYQEQKSYILIHESLHKLFTYVRTNKDHSAHIGLTELFKIAQDIRYEDPYHGLSANGSDRH